LNKELTNGKSKIYSVILKYGYSNFILEILEYCDLIDVIKREQYYIDLLNPEYNIDLTAGSRLGSKHDEEARAKMKAAHVGRELSVSQKEYLVNMIATNVGRKHGEVAKIKQSVAALGRKVSEETRAKLVAASTKALKIKVIDMETGETTIYASVRRAAEVIGCSHKPILCFFNLIKKKAARSMHRGGR
jgi:group I intron endonuclease